MLYKKVHRQYLREFRLGRKFRFDGEVYKVTTKPVTTDSTIFIFCDNVWLFSLFSTAGRNSGLQLWNRRGNVMWLD